jgi:hypothetical protein
VGNMVCDHLFYFGKVSGSDKGGTVEDYPVTTHYVVAKWYKHMRLICPNVSIGEIAEG